MPTPQHRMLAVALLAAICLGAVVPLAVAQPLEAEHQLASGPATAGTSSGTSAVASAPAEVPAPVESQDATPPAPLRLEDDDPGVIFGGVWAYRNGDGDSGRSYRYSRTYGASVRTAFYGTGVTWVAPVGPNRGRARVYIDGVAAGTADLYGPASASQQPVWSVAGLPDARHTIKVVVLNSRNASSTASYVHVDAFDFEGRPAGVGPVPGARVQNGDARLYRKGPWSTFKRAEAYGRTVAMTTMRNAGYVVRFKGSAVTWFGRKNGLGGESEVWLDGRRVATVDQYSPSQAEHRVVYAASGLSDRVHTLRIRALSAPAAVGGGTRTELDAFQVRGTVLTAFRPTPFKYPWKTYIVIDKSSYKLYWVKNGWLIKVYPVAHGRNNCTPERVWRIDAKYHTSPGSVSGPRKMRLFKRIKTSHGYRYVFSAYGIHGTNQEWVIGTQASHGCIRMYNRDVLELFPQVPLGTMVVTRK